MQIKQKLVNPHRLFVGSFTPNWLLRRPEVTFAAKIIYGRLCQYAGEKGIAFPKRKAMAQELGTSERTCDRYLEELKQHKLIFIRRMGLQKANRYYFLEHPWMGINDVDDSEEDPDDLPDLDNEQNMSTPDSPTLATQEILASDSPTVATQDLPTVATPIGRESREENHSGRVFDQNASTTLSGTKPSAKKTPAKPSKQSKVKASTLPEDWTLPDEWKQWALDASGWTNEFIESQADKFHDHHLSKATKSVNWQASWRYWCRNSAEYKGISLKTKVQLKAEAKQAKTQKAKTPTINLTAISPEFKKGWGIIQNALYDKTGPATFKSWLVDLIPIENIEGHLTISTPTRFTRDWIQKNYYDDIKLLCGEVIGAVDISFVVEIEKPTHPYNAHKQHFSAQGDIGLSI